MARKRTFFPHLHLHDEHSIKDGCASCETYGDLTQELEGESLCITNHGMAAGFARQWFACRDRKIKPIFGMEAYINEARHKPVPQLLKTLRADVKSKKPMSKERLARAEIYMKERFRPSRHAIILAKNLEGYKNLVRMSTDSWMNGYYYVPRTDTKFLEENAGGLIFSTACIGGYIPKMARENWHKAVEEARRLKGIFGDDFYAEVMITEYAEQEHTNKVILKLARELKLPIIITCDVHYAKASDSLAQDVLLLMRDKKTIKARDAGEGGWQFDAKDLWFRTLEDVIACWQEHHSHYLDRATFMKAIKNTYALADSIDDIEFSTDLKLPGIFPNPEPDLRELVIKGFKQKLGRQIPVQGKSRREYLERIKRELSVINSKGFAEYFLLLHDICDHARSIGAAMGPGRGSSGGSLVAFLCGITDIDPLRFGLLFERFLDESRSDPPDIDLDFSPQHRDDIKKYIQERYPTTATIGTYGTFKAKGVLQAVGKVFDVPYKETLKATKPMADDADKKDWPEIFELWPDVKAWSERHPEAFEVAKVLKGLISYRGRHAAGILVAPADAMDMLPMVKEPGEGGGLCTAFADTQGDGVKYKGRELSRLGCLKIDILGIQNLNIAPRAVSIVSRDHGIEINLSEIPLDDPDTLELASAGDVPGAFQLDTPVSRPILQKVEADTFTDLVMVTALARPGPLKHGIHNKYAKLKRTGDAWADDLDEILVERLEDSRGLMILQEDVMAVVQVMGGYTGPEANALRKIISKKHPEAIKLWKDRFIDGGLERGYADEELQDVWDKITTFAGYGFCKAHAVAYMLTAYRQLYMLAHYPLPYFAALLAETPRGKKTQRDDEKLVQFMRSAMARGSSVLPPHILKSHEEFDVEGDSIRFGLSKIKGVAGASTELLEARPFKSLEELFEKVNKRRVNARVIQALIYSGALDDLPHQRPDWIDVDDPIEIRNSLIACYSELKKAKVGPEILTPSKLRQAESELLGLTLSWWASKKKEILRKQEGLKTIADALEADTRRLAVLAEVTRVRTHKSRSGVMAFLAVADETGTLDNMVIWASQFKAFRDSFRIGRIVAIRLKRQENENRDYGRWSYFLDDCSEGTPVIGANRLMRRG